MRPTLLRNAVRPPISAFARFNSSTSETETKVEGPVIGIDLGMFASTSMYSWIEKLFANSALILGTTNSAVSVMEGNIPKVIENSEGMFLSLGKNFVAW